MIATSDRARPAPVIAVGSRPTVRSGHRRLILVGVLLLALSALSYVRQASLVAGAGYDVQELAALRQRRLAAVEQLRFHLAAARGLERVAQEAERRGFGPPERTIYVRVAPPAERVATPAATAPRRSAAAPDDWFQALLKWLQRGR